VNLFGRTPPITHEQAVRLASALSGNPPKLGIDEFLEHFRSLIQRAMRESPGHSKIYANAWALATAVANARRDSDRDLSKLQDFAITIVERLRTSAAHANADGDASVIGLTLARDAIEKIAHEKYGLIFAIKDAEQPNPTDHEVAVGAAAAAMTPQEPTVAPTSPIDPFVLGVIERIQNARQRWSGHQHGPTVQHTLDLLETEIRSHAERYGVFVPHQEVDKPGREV
jgi:hypothetical protein